MPYIASDQEEVKHQDIVLEFSINQKAAPVEESGEYEHREDPEKLQEENGKDMVYSDSNCNLSSVMIESLPDVNTIRS